MGRVDGVVYDVSGKMTTGMLVRWVNVEWREGGCVERRRFVIATNLGA
jgi:hypothetical protein